MPLFQAHLFLAGICWKVLGKVVAGGSFAKMPKFGRRSDADEACIQEAVTRLRTFSGFIDTPRLRKAIERWVEEKRVEAAKDIDRVKDVYRKRAAVIGFRCGVVHCLLAQDGGQEATAKGQFREPKSAIQFALMMADYALDQQIRAFGEALQSTYVTADSECQRHGQNMSIFDQLPPTFTLDDLAALKPSQLPRNSIVKIVSRWKRDGWVEKADGKHWKKTAKSDNDKVTSDIKDN